MIVSRLMTKEEISRLYALEAFVQSVEAFLDELDGVLPGARDKASDDGTIGPGLARWIGEQIVKMQNEA